MIPSRATAARGNLRGHPADWQMAEIEAPAGRMSRLVLEPLAAPGAKFPRSCVKLGSLAEIPANGIALIE